jgi:predicted CXXCH cytochrome family protein
MTRRRLRALAIAGGIALALGVGPRARAGVPAGAQYAGSMLCTACHKGTHPQQVSGWAASAHAHAIWKAGEGGEGVRIVADFSKSPPFAQDKASYVLGVGRRQQAFLDANLSVLPGRWTVKDKAWGPQGVVDARSDCLGCHTTGYDPAAATWKELGVGCEMCHGPGSTHAGSADKKATIVNLTGLDPAHQAMVCGQCHSKGTSKDGKYTFPAGFRPGDELDQFFTLSTDSATWTQNAQYNQLLLGGGKHLAAGVVCTTCHDPHGTSQWLLRGPINDLCLKCHQGKLTGAQHGEQVLKTVTCSACHMPGGSHVFVVKKATS